MKFKFENNLQHHTDAVRSVVAIFDNNGSRSNDEEFCFRSFGHVVANTLDMDNRVYMREKIRSIQEVNDIPEDERIKDYINNDFSVEMETGTGKTYVYLKTILELNRRYNLKKFIVIVPSVAIKEGVVKTIEQTKEHFFENYKKHFEYFSYDSKNLSKVKDFALADGIYIMVLTIQAFNRDKNVLRGGETGNLDRFHGEKPIELIADTKPVVVLDEPQNMKSDLAKASIRLLNPLFTLRYSATHKEPYNLMYRLTPFDAYNVGLVKKIEVIGSEDEDESKFIFNVLDIKTTKTKYVAKVEIEKKIGDTFEKQVVSLSIDDRLKEKTKNKKYEGLWVSEIHPDEQKVGLSDGSEFFVGQDADEDKESIFREQIKSTIQEHIQKQEKFGDTIKVLSLFFIDKVDNYVHDDSRIRKIFEEEFENAKAGSSRFKECSANEVHAGYFSRKNKQEYQDTTGVTKKDKETYNLIMKNKERLLSFDEKVSFIFSHSALREGWDNPNVFQICTLAESRDEMTKRQKIGRGLRLPVNVDGTRIYDRDSNVLTVVANESFKNFSGSLQREFRSEGYTNSPEVFNKRERKTVHFNKRFEVDEDFNALWENIQKKTVYNIRLDYDVFVEKAIKAINTELDIHKPNVVVSKTQVLFADGVVKGLRQYSRIADRSRSGTAVGNFLIDIIQETGLTKTIIAKILLKTDNLHVVFDNPTRYTREVIRIMRKEFDTMVFEKGLQYTPVNDVWEMGIFEDFDSYKSKLLEGMKKSVYEDVRFDSEGEKEFAQALEASANVVLFTKLPTRFVVKTPFGDYNPDWAIVWKKDGEEERLYLVRETKFIDGEFDEELRNREIRKIVCGRKHFEAIDANFKVVKESDLSDLL